MPTTNDWDEQVDGLRNLAESFTAIERKALREVANVIKPRLLAVTPQRVDTQQGGDSLAYGALRTSIRGRVQQDKSSGKLSAVVDFGKSTFVAHLVDVGHRAPYARALTRAGHEVTGKPTPAHPFVRGVQDSTADLAQHTYEAAMTEGITAALEGK